MNPLAKSYLVRIFQTAVTAVMPEALVRNALRITEDGLSLRCGTVAAAIRREEVRNVYLVGGGKAARGMGDAAASVLGDMVAGGVVAVPEEAGGEAGPIRYIEAGHPIPDEGSREAARCVMELLSNAEQGDLVVALLSGGGSAMLSDPPGAISIGEKERVLRLLLRSGADIGEVNTVRRHLSLVKGGRMAETAYPARVWALLLSDVAGDDPSVIASGPFSPDPTTYRDALRVLARFRILPQVPDSVILHLESGAAGKIPETLKPGDPACRGVTTAVLASNRTALEAAADAARSDRAVSVRTMPGFLRGEARECGRAFVAEMRNVAVRTSPGRTVLLLAGGETTVTVTGKGRGGRCQEFALSAAIALDGAEGMGVLCGATDGIDGVTDATGGFAYGDTCARARAKGLSPRAHLDDNDSFSLFSEINNLFRTGLTGTNVSDIAIGVIAPGRREYR